MKGFQSLLLLLLSSTGLINPCASSQCSNTTSWNTWRANLENLVPQRLSFDVSCDDLARTNAVLDLHSDYFRAMQEAELEFVQNLPSLCDPSSSESETAFQEHLHDRLANVTRATNQHVHAAIYFKDMCARISTVDYDYGRRLETADLLESQEEMLATRLKWAYTCGSVLFDHEPSNLAEGHYMANLTNFLIHTGLQLCSIQNRNETFLEWEEELKQVMHSHDQSNPWETMVKSWENNCGNTSATSNGNKVYEDAYEWQRNASEEDLSVRQTCADHIDADDVINLIGNETNFLLSLVWESMSPCQLLSDCLEEERSLQEVHNDMLENLDPHSSPFWNFMLHNSPSGGPYGCLEGTLYHKFQARYCTLNDPDKDRDGSSKSSQSSPFSSVLPAWCNTTSARKIISTGMNHGIFTGAPSAFTLGVALTEVEERKAAASALQSLYDWLMKFSPVRTSWTYALYGHPQRDNLENPLNKDVLFRQNSCSFRQMLWSKLPQLFHELHKDVLPSLRAVSPSLQAICVAGTHMPMPVEYETDLKEEPDSIMETNETAGASTGATLAQSPSPTSAPKSQDFTSSGVRQTRIANALVMSQLLSAALYTRLV